MLTIGSVASALRAIVVAAASAWRGGLGRGAARHGLVRAAECD